MKANPGGQIAIVDIIGRDSLARELWSVLERQSLILISERRVGKTCLIKKMHDECRPDQLAILQQLEGVRTPLEFVERVCTKVESYLSGVGQTISRVRALAKSLAGIQIAGLVKFPDTLGSQWKSLLEATIADLMEHRRHRVVFFWDELPLMLDKIRKSSGEQIAMDVLDVLRSLRHVHAELRMVYTGSIGLHNVITALKQAGYANAPTNDMQTEIVPPLAMSDAIDLAWRLLDGEGVPTSDREGVALVIAEQTDRVPFYIHHVVDRMKNLPGDLDTSHVERIVHGFLTESHGRLQMGHYRERLDTYYPAGDLPLALTLLNTLAAADDPLSRDDLFARVKARIVTNDVAAVARLLDLLKRDQYLVQDSDDQYAFRFSLVKRWWKMNEVITS